MKIDLLRRPLNLRTCGMKSFITIVSTLIVACGNTGGQRDKALEELIQQRFRDAITSQRKSVSMKDLGVSIQGRLCFQRPYMTKKAFEEVAGINPTGFEGILDGANVWWLISDNGNSKWVVIPSVAIAELDHKFAKHCVQLPGAIMNISTYTSIHGESLIYNFKE